jgi:hypothetical protein
LTRFGESSMLTFLARWQNAAAVSPHCVISIEMSAGANSGQNPVCARRDAMQLTSAGLEGEG